jgi:hypothetical protein
MRVGSITKAFTGKVLAHLTVDGTVRMAQPLIKTAPEFAGKADVARIRLIDLVTHSGGLPRELPHEPGPKDDPHAPININAFAKWLHTEPLLFKPGHAVLYSNFGFDLLPRPRQRSEEALSLPGQGEHHRSARHEGHGVPALRRSEKAADAGGRLRRRAAARHSNRRRRGPLGRPLFKRQRPSALDAMPSRSVRREGRRGPPSRSRALSRARRARPRLRHGGVRPHGRHGTCLGRHDA